MKKLFALLLVFALAFGLAGCGTTDSGKTDVNEPPVDDAPGSEPPVDEPPAAETVAERYNLDLQSTEVQPMSEDRADIGVLIETSETFLGGEMYFPDTEYENLTYDDLAEHIGCDASEYYFDADNDAECYTWYAGGDRTGSALAIWICDGTLYYLGAVNLYE